jgi:hypothetical protein
MNRLCGGVKESHSVSHLLSRLPQKLWGGLMCLDPKICWEASFLIGRDVVALSGTDEGGASLGLDRRLWADGLAYVLGRKFPEARVNDDWQ